jgi:hypothetical protein
MSDRPTILERPEGSRADQTWLLAAGREIDEQTRRPQSMTRVSVIIPTSNRSHLLADAIKAALEQTEHRSGTPYDR